MKHADIPHYCLSLKRFSLLRTRTMGIWKFLPSIKDQILSSSSLSSHRPLFRDTQHPAKVIRASNHYGVHIAFRGVHVQKDCWYLNPDKRPEGWKCSTSNWKFSPTSVVQVAATLDDDTEDDLAHTAFISSGSALAPKSRSDTGTWSST